MKLFDNSLNLLMENTDVFYKLIEDLNCKITYTFIKGQGYFKVYNHEQISLIKDDGKSLLMADLKTNNVIIIPKKMT